MKRIKWAVGMMFMMISLCSCRMENPLEMHEIKEEKEVVAYFDSLNMAIENIELVKRQTNEDDKTDIVYAKVIIGNAEATCEAEFIFESVYYDEGGWVVENVVPNEQVIYEPKGEPDIEKLLTEAYEGSRYDNVYHMLTLQEEKYKYNVAVFAQINGTVSEYSCDKYDVVYFDNTIGKWIYTISNDEENTRNEYVLKDMDELVLEYYGTWGGICRTKLYIKNGELIISEIIHEGYRMEIQEIYLDEKTFDGWIWYVKIKNPRNIMSGRTLVIIIETEGIRIEC